MRGEEWVQAALDALGREGRLRSPSAFAEPGGRIRQDGRTWLNLSSNDYLNLARDPRLAEAAERLLRTVGSGAAASRLMTGTLECHEALERAIARFKGYPAALLFGSGYMANTGVIPALVGRDDFVLADRLCHASIIDGIQLSRATLRRFAHNDAADLERQLTGITGSGRRLVITEAVFSMDGDTAPLADTVDAAERHGAMVMVDEAHATGVFGPRGSGLIRSAGLEGRVHVSMGTLSKALGGYGGFVACSETLRKLLINRARPFIYSTALPPAMLGSALRAIAIVESEPGLGSELLARAAQLRALVQAEGLDTGRSASQIVPVMVGDNRRALAVSERLRGQGILCVAIRPPTVPEGTARLRLSVTLAHTEDDLRLAVRAVAEAIRQEGQS